MGRELKRVPLDFAWPIDKVWSGYLNPHYVECEPCNGSGATLAHHRLSEIVGLLMIAGDDGRTGRCHPYFNGGGFHSTAGKCCGPEMDEVATGLAGRAPGFLGHCSTGRWMATKKILAAAGLPESWGTCTHCDGHGIPKENYAAYDAWEREEPPIGDGYQIWETVSEGSPISPVFATPEELARHMATTRWGGDKGASYETWLRFITGPGWAPTLVMDSRGVHDGVNAA